MKHIVGFVGMAVLAASGAWAQDPDAAAALDRALERQKALPGYVQHVYGPAPMSLPQPGQPSVALGPAHEIGTIEHSGEMSRETYSIHPTEIVRGRGRTAMRIDLTPQVAELHAAAGMVGESRADELTSVGVSTTLLVRELVRGGFDILGDVMAVFDSVSSLRSTARSTEQIVKLADSMEKVSGTWQCKTDDGSGSYPGTRVSVRQLDDESIAGVPTHVYEQTRAFSFPARPKSRAATDDEDDAPTAFEMHSRVWVRSADGLPIRAEFTPPGQQTQRTEFSYPATVAPIEFPACSNSR